MTAPEKQAAATVREALYEAASRLRRGGIENAGDDARRLLCHVLGLSSAELIGAQRRPLCAAAAERFARFIERRLLREPTSRILGARDFYGRSFALSAATLDPRPDSETLVTAALDLAREEGWLHAPLRILDVGTGSGCLLITLLLELPHASGVGSDISTAALNTARGNAELLNVADRSQFIAADALDGIAGRFDIMVCNPPYISSAEIARLAPEVRSYDPHQSLDGGSDGLSFFRRLAAGMERLVPDGWIILEVGHDQADAVAALVAARGRQAPLREFRDVAGRRRSVATRTRILRGELPISTETP